MPEVKQMQKYQEILALSLARSGALFFKDGLRLKDGRPTPYFANLGVFHTGKLAYTLGQSFAAWMVHQKLESQVDIILGPSYKASAIAQALALALFVDQGIDLSFEYDRKEAKTHGEATGLKNLFVTGALTDGAQVLIVDDVGTSMATKIDLLEKLATHERSAGIKLEIKGVALALDREQVQAVYDSQGQVIEGARGADALSAFTQSTGVPVWPLLGIGACMEYLHAAKEPVMINGVSRPLDDEHLQNFRNYQATYGR